MQFSKTNMILLGSNKVLIPTDISILNTHYVSEEATVPPDKYSVAFDIQKSMYDLFTLASMSAFAFGHESRMKLEECDFNVPVIWEKSVEKWSFIWKNIFRRRKLV